ncbi:MAG: WxcM-like protein [Clostridiaceae bacterium]|jgi:dTDP-4-dehydrorhamnose 3,5-epimerase-like enzyme|nr:WxcM-like protein [Clostridiaceae bacterium]
MIEGVQKIKFEIHGDHRGSLIAIENFKEIPFVVKRLYYIFNTSDNVVRGKHAHKKLQQMVICMSGSCDFMVDNGLEREVIHLDNNSEGLYINKPVWREMSNFSSDCVLVVLASEIYDTKDYIHSYEEFVAYNKEC